MAPYSKCKVRKLSVASHSTVILTWLALYNAKPG